jgi:type II secretory pathway predicted ATPase ExeA
VEHLSTFGLTRDPFANEPQLDLFFEGISATDAVARLRRAAQQRKGLAVLTGPGGVGKTMLARHFLEGLEEEMFEACLLVPVPGVSDGKWVIDRLARQLGVESPAEDRAGALAELYEQLAIVREDGRSTVVILDEAQVLAEQGVLAELRGLLNLEYEEKRLLTLVLVGLPSLAKAVATEPALADRVDVPLRLGKLGEEEAGQYLTHRIRAAGGNPAILESGAVSTLVKWAGGVPRRLNALADSALFEAHMAGRVSATAGDVERAALELELPTPEAIQSPPPAAPVTEAPVPPVVEAAVAPVAPAAVVERTAPTPVLEAPALSPDLTSPVAPVAEQSPSPISAEPSPLALAAPDLEAVFAEEDAPLELEEVVAVGTDPVTGANGADGASPFSSEALAPETSPDATVALFGEPEDLSAPNEDSAGDLDDLFADLVQE